MKMIPYLCARISGLAAVLSLLAAVPSVRAASASWNAAPTSGNWEASATENNWSTGLGAWPGGTSTSSGDTATFNSASTFTAITIGGSAWNVKNVVFDTANCAAYTITSTEGNFSARWTGGGAITLNSTVTQPQVFNGNAFRMHSGGGLSLINNATDPGVTLTFAAGIKANNSTSANPLDQAVNLQGVNPGNNTFGGVIADYGSPSKGQYAAVTKSGTGTWYLTANNTYTGPTLITGGTLFLRGDGAINHSTNIVISGAGAILDFTNAMALTAVDASGAAVPSCLSVTNSGALQMTNTAEQTPLVVDDLVISNATVRLAVDGAMPFYNITVNQALDAGPNITLAIDQVADLASATTFTLITYPGADPSPADFTVKVPAGYTAGPVTVGGGTVSVTITPPSFIPLVWVGATNSVLVSNWDTSQTKNWVDAATLSVPQVYKNPDPVQFDDTALNSTVTLITTNSPMSVTVNNNTLNYLFNGGGKISDGASLTKQGNATLTLAETGGDDFGGGIVLNGGTLILDSTNCAISGGLAVNSGTTAQIGENDGGGALPLGAVEVEGTLIFSHADNLAVSTPIFGYGTLIQNGSGTLALSSPLPFAGNTIVSQGVLALTGAGSISNCFGLVVSNAAFDVSGVAGPTLLTDFNITNATLTLGVSNLLAAVSVNSFEVDGSASHNNLINVTALPPIASYPSTITLIKSVNPITLAGGHFNFALGSLPAGSPAYAGSLTESADQTAVQITLTAGPVGVRPSVTWAGVDYATATTNWSDRLNWLTPGAPVSTDNVLFDGTTTVSDSATVNNVVDHNFAVATLTYDQTMSGQWHVTQIPAGVSLSVSGATTIGGMTANGVTTSVAMTDAGTLQLNGNLAIGNNGSSSLDSGTTLDLSALSNFVCNASSGSVTMGTGNRSTANFKLAGVSNNITAATFNANASSSSSSGSGTLTLGAGTNILNVGTFNIAGQRSSCTVQFPAGAAGGLRLRGTGGTEADRTTLTLGYRQASGSGGTTTGTLALNGFPVDLKLGTLMMGYASSVAANTGTGNLQFDTGIVDATTINMASCTVAGATANGTITIGANGALIVGAGGLSLVNQAAGTSTGTLDLEGGRLICSNSILKSTSAGTANVTFNGGTVNLVAGVIGTLAAPIDSLTLDGGTVLQMSVTPGVTNLVANVNASGTTTINIGAFIGVTGPAQIPVISYTGADPYANLVLGTVPANYTVGNGGALVDDTANQTIDIIVTPPAPKVWVGAVGLVLNSAWDTSTLDWVRDATPSIYADGDFVQFDDTASNNLVTLTGTFAPGGLAVNNSALNYTFSGSGKITGFVGLAKQGAGTLILDNSGTNDFTGGVNLAGGTLQIGNNDANGNLPAGNVIDNGGLVFSRSDSNTVASVISGAGSVTQNGTGATKLAAINTYSGATVISTGMIIATNAAGGNSSIGSTAGACIITNGGTLDIEFPTQNTMCFTNTADTAGKPFFIAGAGVGGNGAIVNNGTANQIEALQSLTLTADATVGGPARWDLRVPNGHYQPILDLGGHTLTKTGSNQMSMVAVVVTNGGGIVINSGILSFETISSNATTPITVNAGGVLGHYRENAGFFTAPITLNGGMIRDLNGTPGSTNDSPITLTADSFLDLNVGSADLLQLNGVISESGGSFGLTKTNAGTYALSAVNTYSGTTDVAQGRLMLVGNGSIAPSRLLNVAAGATLDASQRNDGALTLGANQTLSGFGTVNGAVTNSAGATIAPGSPTSVGTLAFANNVILAGTTVMKLDRTAGATNDVLRVAGALTEGGALNIALNGGTYAAGDTFTLFSATGGISGAFTATNLPALPGGLGWNTTGLANGVLSIVATVNPNPTNVTAAVNGSTLTLAWPADHIGWRLQVQTNAWGAGLGGHWVDVPGSTNVNNEVITIDPSQGTVFYRMVYP